MSTNEKLTGLIQLPDVRALKWEVTHHDRGRLAPGYWFVAPYGQINPEQHTQKYQQYQVGPHIYDNDGVCDLSYLVVYRASEKAVMLTNLSN